MMVPFKLDTSLKCEFFVLGCEKELTESWNLVVVKPE
jgi:hypothetical protein